MSSRPPALLAGRHAGAATLVLLAAMAAMACGSAADEDVAKTATQGSDTSARQGITTDITSAPFASFFPRDVEWSGVAGGQEWSLRVRGAEGERCLHLEFREAHETCASSPTLDSSADTPIVPLAYQLGLDSMTSVIVGLVPENTSSVELVSATHGYEIFLDQATGVFLIIGPVDGEASSIRLSVGGEQVECEVDEEVRDLAYLC